MNSRRFTKRIFSENRPLPTRGTVRICNGKFYINDELIERQKIKKQNRTRYKNLPCHINPKRKNAKKRI